MFDYKYTDLKKEFNIQELHNLIESSFENVTKIVTDSEGNQIKKPTFSVIFEEVLKTDEKGNKVYDQAGKNSADDDNLTVENCVVIVSFERELANEEMGKLEQLVIKINNEGSRT